MADSDHTYVGDSAAGQPQVTINDVMDKFLEVIGVDKDLARQRGQIIRIDEAMRENMPYKLFSFDNDKDYIHINIKAPRPAVIVPEAERGAHTQGLSMSRAVAIAELPDEKAEKTQQTDSQDTPVVRADVAARLFNSLLPRFRLSNRGLLNDESRTVWVFKHSLPEAMQILDRVAQEQKALGNPLQGALAFGCELQTVIAKHRAFLPPSKEVKVRIRESHQPGSPQIQIYNASTRQQDILFRKIQAAGVSVTIKDGDLLIDLPPKAERKPLLTRIEAQLATGRHAAAFMHRQRNDTEVLPPSELEDPKAQPASQQNPQGEYTLEEWRRKAAVVPKLFP